MSPPHADARLTVRHSRKPNGFAADAQCPYCGQPISSKEIMTRIQAREREQIAKAEKVLNERFATELNAAKIKGAEIAEREIKKATAAKDAEIKARVQAEREASVMKVAQATSAARAAEQQLRKMKHGQDAVIKARIESERDAAAKRLNRAVNAEKTKGLAERLKLTEQLEALRSRLERRDRPAGQLGEEGELDAFTLLSETFSADGDEITRTKKFSSGGDIEHRIANGAGLILYEVKNHQQYQSKWTARAKENQLAAQAEHVVIVTCAFPANHRQLMLSDDGVLVVSPERLLAVALWLRAHTIRSHSLKLSNQHRQTKAARLYEFMCGDRAADRWGRMAQTVARMRGALRSERLNHEKAWSDRGNQLDVIAEIRNSFVEDLDSIFEATDAVEDVS